MKEIEVLRNKLASTEEYYKREIERQKQILLDEKNSELEKLRFSFREEIRQLKLTQEQEISRLKE